MKDMSERITEMVEEISRVEVSICSLSGMIQLAAIIIVKALLDGNKILLCGNGGSAAEALHFAGELIGRFKFERKPFPALVLGSNFSAITAISNDYSYDVAFKREVEGFGKVGDILVVLSTSGNSKNVIEAVGAAKKLGIKTIGFLGRGGKLKELVDLPLLVDSDSTPRIQEVHLMLIHIISELVEGSFFGEGK